MSIITELRKLVHPDYDPFSKIKAQPTLYKEFLGESKTDQAEAIAKCLLPDSTPNADEHRQRRQEIFKYLVTYLHHSTFQADMFADIGKGVNLARRPYLAPTGLILKDGAVKPAMKIKNEDDLGEFRFWEQYRWDSYFQNKFLLLIGADKIAIDQLLNLVEVYDTYKRIPNALTTEFLSHPQPPFEALAAYEILEHRKASDVKNPTQTDDGQYPNWFDEVMRVVGQELLTEWWDHGSIRIHPRQDANYHDAVKIAEQEDTYRFFNKADHPYLTRYTSIHFHPLIVGCQDGKDHHRLTSKYGEHFLSVQLHALIYGMLGKLIDYHQTDSGSPDLLAAFTEARDSLGKDIRTLMWDKHAADEGAFRNYSLREGGPIQYGDLSAEIFPLFVGLAEPWQAEITLKNLKKYYQGDIGLASTQPDLGIGGPLQKPVPGWPDGKTQWERNAWPPLMIVAVEGLLRPEYAAIEGIQEFAIEVMQRWVAWIEHAFYAGDLDLQGTIREKAPYRTEDKVNKGFYGNLVGFGWTIASYGTFLNRLSQIEQGIEGVMHFREEFRTKQR